MSKKESFHVTLETTDPAHESVAIQLATDAVDAVLASCQERVAAALGHPWVIVESIHVELPRDRAEHFGWPKPKLSLIDLANVTGEFDCLEEIFTVWMRKKGKAYAEASVQALAIRIESTLDETNPPENIVAIFQGVDRAHQTMNLQPPNLHAAPKTTRLWCRVVGAQTVDPSNFPNEDPNSIKRLNLFRSAAVSMADGHIAALAEGMREIEAACEPGVNAKQAKKMKIAGCASMALVGRLCESFDGMAFVIERALSLDDKPVHKLETMIWVLHLVEEELSGFQTEVHPVASRILADLAADVASMDPSRKVLGQLRKARREEFAMLGDTLDNACARAEAIIQRAELAKAAQEKRGRGITAIAPRRAFSL